MKIFLSSFFIFEITVEEENFVLVVVPVNLYLSNDALAAFGFGM